MGLRQQVALACIGSVVTLLLLALTRPPQPQPQPPQLSPGQRRFFILGDFGSGQLPGAGVYGCVRLGIV